MSPEEKAMFDQLEKEANIRKKVVNKIENVINVMKCFALIARSNPRGLDNNITDVVPALLRCLRHRYLHLDVQPLARSLTRVMQKPITTSLANRIMNVIEKLFAYKSKNLDDDELQNLEDAAKGHLEDLLQTILTS